VQNKANLGSRPWECGMWSEGAWQMNESVKQSQLGAEDKGETPSPRTPYGITTSGTCSAGQSQFGSECGLGVADCGLPRTASCPPLARNKANWVGSWPVGRGTGWVFPSVASTRRSVQNKANSRPGALGVRSKGRRAPRQTPVASAGVRNKANWEGSPETGDRRREATAGALCETKPIRGTGPRPPC